MTYEKAVENTPHPDRGGAGSGGEADRASQHHPAFGRLNSRLFSRKSGHRAPIANSGLSYAILRPTVIFGVEDVLINNIAWLLRHFPVFAIPGSGEYRLQPVFVVDVAEMAASACKTNGNTVIDAVGPETYTFQELVQLIAGKVGSRAKILHLRPSVALFLSRLVGKVVHDVVLTKDEVEGLMAGLLVSQNAPTGRTRLSQWASRHAHLLGMRYASELNRHFRIPGTGRVTK